MCSIPQKIIAGNGVKNITARSVINNRTLFKEIRRRIKYIATRMDDANSIFKKNGIHSRIPKTM
jgi:hypothetical protein